jgi:hypothetical protein
MLAHKRPKEYQAWTILVTFFWLGIKYDPHYVGVVYLCLVGLQTCQTHVIQEKSLLT